MVKRAPGLRKTRTEDSSVGYSLGTKIILAIAVLSTIAILLWPVPKRQGLQMWTFGTAQLDTYTPIFDRWNTVHPAAQQVHGYAFSMDALTQRMMSGFLSKTPVADLIEVERSQTAQFFTGPLEDVGFVDLTDRVKAEGLLEGPNALNTPSFSPWTSRHRIFGLPHDVHPVMLAYRADIIEAAGIDMTKIETWDDFTRVMRPLVHDGTQYPLSIWYTSADQIEALILQAGGNYFDMDGNCVLNSDVNARVISQIIAWGGGPDRIAADAPEFNASGNKERLDGYVLCTIMPDWLSGTYRNDLAQLSGKMKLIPLPAWKKGGCRTAVWGGSMLGISKQTKDVDTAWALAKQIYLSEENARKIFMKNGVVAGGIVTPCRSLWKSAFYDTPDPYFCGQAQGRLYLNLAPTVPLRTSSPFNMLAKDRLGDAMVGLHSFAENNQVYTVDGLLDEAHRQLAIAQAEVQKQMDRNVFLKERK